MSPIEPLPKRPFDSTGIEVGCVGLGCSPFGHAYGSPNEDAAIAAVQEAFRQGVNFFDVAPFYAAGDAEKLLGRALKGLPRSQIIVATKVGKYKAGEPEDFSAERVTQSVHESLERLQLEYIDVIQCHDIESAKDMKQIVTETIPALQKLKKQGLVRFIGITGLPLDIYTYVLDRVPVGSVDCILSYCHNNLSDNTLVELLPYLKEKRVAVISASFSSMGLLTQKGPPAWHPAPKNMQAAARKAAALCEEKGTDLAKIAIKEFVRTPGIAVHLMGMCTPEEVLYDTQVVREALGLVPNPKEALENEVLQEVKELLKPHLNTTWKTGRSDNRTP
ncbi:hypothetical protein WJX72_000807 [[Myrmecia] bisecta]|uniref:NADP-dependent oxidoreductase domain-containing protein n=1 Tax=[Myrmecia] bisecta TaxID=41462 RepID=A0AAW1QE11_9CHLO